MKRLTALFVPIALVLSSTTIFAQIAKEGSIWYFEGGFGLDFNFDPPNQLLDGRVYWQGKSSAICDRIGNLLFYTSGDSVWTNNHEPMLNGYGLNGANFPIYTTSVIVPHPGDGQLYYIFKANLEHDNVPFTGLHYSVVDISRDNGLGEVIYKKHNFIPVTSPFLTVTRHADEKSYWVIAHGWVDNLFYAIHVTEAGVSDPVVSAIGSSYGNVSFNSNMQMKISPDGTKIAVTQSGGAESGFVHLYDFNSKTGSVSNYRELNIWSTGGVEFSPNSELMYVTAYSKVPFETYPGIAQFDVNSGIKEDIMDSEVQVGDNSYLIELGELQLGPDGKIYGGDQFGGQQDPNLCVITNPNMKGMSCNFVDEGPLFPYWASPQRLPLFVQSIFRESPAVPEAMGCTGIPSQVRVTSLGYADSLQWDFGDGIQSSFPFATGKIVNHVYEQTGEYTLRVKKYIGNLSREIVSKTIIIERPVVDIGADTILCRGDELVLDAGNNGMDFLWSNGETVQQIMVQDENQYQVTVDNGVCKISDFINVQVYDYPIIELGQDEIICDKEIINLSVPLNSELNYIWNTGATSNEISIQESGLYKVIVSRGRCETVDSVRIQFGQIALTLSNTELKVPFEEEMNLEVSGTNMENWFWIFGDGIEEHTTSPEVSHKYLKAGEYEGQIMITNQWGCSASESFYVYVPEHLFIPNVITPFNYDSKNDLFEIQYNGNKQPSLVVYDRSGNKLFSSNSLENKWPTDDIDPGTYFYQLKLGTDNYKGWVQVIK